MTPVLRTVPLLAVILLASGSAPSTGAGERALFAPKQPVRGDTVTVVYAPSDGPLQELDSVAAEILFVRESELPLQRTLALRRGAGQWSGSVQVPDSDVTLLLVQFVAGGQVDDNNGNVWHLMVHGPDGTPVRGAHLARAAVLQRSEYYSYRHKRDPEGMKQELDLERALYPENWRASIMEWNLLMRSPGGEEAVRMVRVELDSVYAREQGNQRVVAQLLPWFEQTGQIERAERIRATAIAGYPLGPVAEATAWAEVFQEMDLVTRLEKAGKLLADGPLNEGNHDALVAAMVSAYTKLGQYDEAVRAAEKARVAEGGLYNSIAWPLVEKGERLEDAVRWASQGVDIVRAQTPAEKPPYLSERAWRSRQQRRLGMILDTYALGLFKLGRLQEAERAYEEVDSLFEGQEAETGDRLAETYLKNGKPLKALEVTRRMIRTASTTEETQALHREAYIAHTGAAQGLDAEREELRVAAEEHLRNELQAKQVSIPAPAFSLKSLDGSEVRLSDLKGKVVIVDFWATWCGPCKMSFPYLQRFYERHRDNDVIALFAVNTWEREQGEQRQKTVRKFLADNKYTFPVLFDDTTVEEFGVEGIPTRFVIDQEGMIRFESIGFEGGEKMLTQMELQVGLLLEDVPSSSR